MDPYEQINLPDNENVEVNPDDLHLSNSPPPIDFYGVLNISKESTEEEIKDSYKRLCRIFHPDKHVDPEILTDPTKRTIYDMFGEEGLNTSWEIGTRYKTPQELREEFESQNRMKRELEVENLVKSKGDFQLSIDATEIFDPYDRGSGRKVRKPDLSLKSAYENTEITQLFMKHSFETQFQPETRASIVGQTILRNGVGGGNIVGSLRHTFSPKFWAEFDEKAGRNRRISFLSVTSHSHTIYSPPSLFFTGGRRLGTHISGYLTYKTGAWSLGPWGRQGSFSRRDKSAVAIGLNSTKEKSGYAFEIQTGLVESHITANYNRKLLSNYHVKGATTLSTSSGLTTTILGERKVTDNTKVALAIEFGIPSGILFRCRLSRLGQRITIPIQISSEFNLKLILWGTLLPVMTIAVVEQAILVPRRKKKASEKLARLRERHAEYISNRKSDAEESIQLLKPSVERKIEAEREKENGLIILEAWYGNLSRIKDITSENLPKEILDVRIPVQALVHESQLTIPGGYSKSNIMGFYDPCMGEPKQLKIKYQFQRKIHEVTVDDSLPVACPLRSHIVSNN
ncbi:5444_t:CDS:10 [Diversispora eburnea]|uniref:5444_t:CDS:1 n=1 Tax=Diversispora eburnea TaxID=1213867 RepID=A0A9N9A880_9GLOM|nr:5444_t:CDS:10 [Diversispora eburnea]